MNCLVPASGLSAEVSACLPGDRADRFVQAKGCRVRTTFRVALAGAGARRGWVVGSSADPGQVAVSDYPEEEAGTTAEKGLRPVDSTLVLDPSLDHLRTVKATVPEKDAVAAVALVVTQEEGMLLDLVQENQGILLCPAVHQAKPGSHCQASADFLINSSLPFDQQADFETSAFVDAVEGSPSVPDEVV